MSWPETAAAQASSSDCETDECRPPKESTGTIYVGFAKEKLVEATLMPTPSKMAKLDVGIFFACAQIDFHKYSIV